MELKLNSFTEKDVAMSRQEYINNLKQGDIVQVERGCSNVGSGNVFMGKVIEISLYYSRYSIKIKWDNCAFKDEWIDESEIVVLVKRKSKKTDRYTPVDFKNKESVRENDNLNLLAHVAGQQTQTNTEDDYAEFIDESLQDQPENQGKRPKTTVMSVRDVGSIIVNHFKSPNTIYATRYKSKMCYLCQHENVDKFYSMNSCNKMCEFLYCEGCLETYVCMYYVKAMICRCCGAKPKTKKNSKTTWKGMDSDHWKRIRDTK